MESGLDKCRKVHLVRDEVDMQLRHDDQAFIETMTEKESYKYLSVLPLKGLQQTAIKCSLLDHFSNAFPQFQELV